MLNNLSPNPKRLAAIASILKHADTSLANLEVPLTNAKTPTTRKSGAEVAARSQYILKADPRNAPLLSNWGFKILTEGNNHAMDFRGIGLAQCLGALDQQHIPHTGAGKNVDFANAPATIPLPDGQTLSVYAALSFAGLGSAYRCTPANATEPGVATLFLSGTKGHPELKRLIAKLRVGNGPVIVFLHWGKERDTLPKPYQVALGRACIDAEADAVIGAHPHVLQGAELYRSRPILYSMGNLLAPNGGPCGLAELSFTGRRFQGLKFHPFYTSAGIAHLYDSAQKKAATEGYRRLAQAIQSSYPSPHSHLIN